MPDRNLGTELAAAKKAVKTLERELAKQTLSEKRRPQGRVERRGTDRYKVSVFVGTGMGGKRTWVSKSVRGTRAEAEAKLKELLDKKKSGTLATSRDTLNEWLDEWLKLVKVSRRARTHDDYRRVLKDYVRPHLGSIKLTRLTSADVRRMLVTLHERGLSPRSLRMAQEVLRNALRSAVLDHLIPENPARTEVVGEALPEAWETEMVTLSGAHLKKFITAAKQERLGALFILLLDAGLRPSEGLGLRWSDVQGSSVSVSRVLVDILVGKEDDPFEKPKTKKSRRPVEVSSVTVKAMRTHRKAQAAERLKAGQHWTDGDLIFCDEIGGPLKLRHVRHHFKKFIKAAGLPSGLTLYGLRHSCASIAHAAGIPLKVVSERLGHSSITLTADTYSHTETGAQKQVADLFARLAR